MKRAKDNTTKDSAACGVEVKTMRADGLAKVYRIIEDEKEAENFFYREMHPKMSALADSLNRSFGLDLTPEDVCVVTHLACWEEDWARLRAYRGGASIHSWVARIASQSMYRFLVEERYIDGVGGTKTSDFRLTVRSIDDVNLRQAIVDLVFIPAQHKALEMHYVKKATDDALAKAFGGEDVAKKLLKDARKTLIEQLLNTENPYAEMALSLKKPMDPETPWQPWHDRIEEGDVSDNHQAMRDLLSMEYGGEDWDGNVMAFTRRVIDALGWNEMQEDIFRARFFSDVPSKELAETYDVERAYIDNAYRTLLRHFKIAAKDWWNMY